MTEFHLRFETTELHFWAARYFAKGDASDDKVVEDIAPRVRERGYYMRQELLC